VRATHGMHMRIHNYGIVLHWFYCCYVKALHIAAVMKYNTSTSSVHIHIMSHATYAASPSAKTVLRHICSACAPVFFLARARGLQAAVSADTCCDVVDHAVLQLLPRPVRVIWPGGCCMTPASLWGRSRQCCCPRSKR
jgi:hypothetical protein